jgi:uncharacterized protein (DUF885 family)
MSSSRFEKHNQDGDEARPTTASSKALHKLFADEQAFTWNEHPLRASYEGQRARDDRLDSDLPTDFERRAAANAKFLERLHAIDSGSLRGEDRVSHDLFDFILTYRVKFAAYMEWRAPWTSDSGFHTDVIQMHEAADTRTLSGYEHYITRLRDVKRYFAENIANMRQGLKDGYTLPAEILPGVASIIEAQQFTNPEDSPLHGPFREFPDSISPGNRARLREEGTAAIVSSVLPAYRDLQTFFRDEYAPRARETIAASSLPNGKAYYTDLVRYYATYDITPDEVHEIGLQEVARIHGEMQETMKAAKFAGSFVDLLAFLRVEPVPATLAPNYTAGRYNAGPNDGRTPGSYWVNTYAPDRRPLYSLPALTLHEAVPGHHLQIALARELKDLPAFRQNTYLSAFGEGWALYTEKLGIEMGMYKTPYEDFGRLSYEMWRACRLVVDTGMHWRNWTRDQALDYLRGNTTLPEHEVRTEIDRYIAWPGQALSYKLGEIKLWALRGKAADALGARFDLRAFHDAVLEEGTLTLPMLERHVDAYIARSGSAAAGN